MENCRQFPCTFKKKISTLRLCDCCWFPRRKKKKWNCGNMTVRRIGRERGGTNEIVGNIVCITIKRWPPPAQPCQPNTVLATVQGSRARLLTQPGKVSKLFIVFIFLFKDYLEARVGICGGRAFRVLLNKLCRFLFFFWFFLMKIKQIWNWIEKHFHW